MAHRDRREREREGEGKIRERERETNAKRERGERWNLKRLTPFSLRTNVLQNKLNAPETTRETLSECKINLLQNLSSRQKRRKVSFCEKNVTAARGKILLLAFSTTSQYGLK